MAAAPLLQGLLMLLPVSPALAEPGNAPMQASEALNFAIVIPSVFRVTRSRPVAGGREVVIWTNMPVVRISDREYRFDRVGEATLFVPETTGGAAIVHGL
ncbi:hypothetical protein ACSFA8_07525 [Variovorax sp. RT4R15]|uniref:hypothetical protein n=1 Tax=Variovorax sp. RT4R15 TaxID=3443737 RepID=UPI003F4867F2